MPIKQTMNKKDNGIIWLPEDKILQFALMVSEQIFPCTKTGLKQFLKMSESRIGKQRNG